MKKRKFNILLNIAVLCMCICAIAIGVYSAKTASLNVSGTIGFTAHNCKVRVLGKITGAVDANNVALNPETTPALKYCDSTDNTKGKLIEGTTDIWDFKNIYFDDLNTDKYHEVNDIVFTFTITNESDYYVDVKVNQDCMKNNDRISIYVPNNGGTLAPQGQGAASSVTLTVKLQLQKVNGEYSNLDAPINLSNATLLNFTKSQAPSYLAQNWKTKISTDFSISDITSTTKISFVKEINDTILEGFDKVGENYKTVSVGAVNETSNAGNLTTSVTDAVAYYNSTNKEIIIYSPARIYAPQNCGEMFKFNWDSALTSLDVSNFDTSKVTDMSGMFYDCEKLASLDVSNFNTSNVTNMSNMFSCRSLTSLDVSNFNTSNVTNMSNMFSCRSLTSLDVSNFNTSKVTNMGSMFSYCSKLASLDVSNFNTSKVTNMVSMFFSCSALASLDLSNFDTNNVTHMDSMFNFCEKLTSLDVSNFNTSKVTKMDSIFSNCKALTSLDVRNFDTSKVKDMSNMFHSCSKLTSLDVSKFDTSIVTKMVNMFRSCSGLSILDLSNFNTSNVTDMGYMFESCSALKTIYVNSTNWNTEKVTSSSKMFYNCTNLVGGADTKYNSFNKNDITYAKVDGGTTAPGYFTGK